MIHPIGIVGGKPQSGEKLNGLLAAGFCVLSEAVQGNGFLLSVLGRAFVHGQLAQPDVAEFHALNGVLAECRIHIGIIASGGNIAADIPGPVLGSGGGVVLIKGQGYWLFGIHRG